MMMLGRADELPDCPIATLLRKPTKRATQKAKRSTPRPLATNELVIVNLGMIPPFEIDVRRNRIAE